MADSLQAPVMIIPALVYGPRAYGGGKWQALQGASHETQLSEQDGRVLGGVSGLGRNLTASDLLILRGERVDPRKECNLAAMIG